MSQDVRRDEESRTAQRAEVLNIAYIDSSKIHKQLFRSILPVQELYELKVVPLAADEHFIHFGITTTTSQQTTIKLIRRFSDQRVVFSLISDSGFQEYMKLYDPPKTVEYDDISVNSPQTQVDKIVDDVSKVLDQVRPDDILAYLVQQAYKLKSSDIHIENQKENVRIRFRIDGVLHPVAYMSHEKYRHLTSVIAAVANVYVDSKDAQTGHISKEYKMATGDNVTVNLRVETVPTVYGMDVVMRMFNMRVDLFKLENLGLNEYESKAVDDIIRHPTGLVLIVGPTGSGKTTTLYSLLNTLNTTERKIITLEDPVEYNIPGIIQIPVEGQLEKQSFAEKLRAVLRLDPDIVMVGEIRDQDTAKTALQGALTGHLVLSTFHAYNTSAALTRLLDMVGDNPLFASAIHLIMAQRLVRRLDDSSKQAYKPDDSLKQQLQRIIDTLPPNYEKPNLNEISLYKAVSTAENPFGYSGQLAIREQMIMTPGIQQVLRLPPKEVTTELIQAKAIEEGMLTMLQDGVLKALGGHTTLEEVFRVVS
jgi:type II secretory ATPase GspE/PulE/Tfp pilus assembly ATPase PilB-like protein